MGPFRRAACAAADAAWDRLVTYDRALKAGRNGAPVDAAVMAVAIEERAARWGLTLGDPGYAFSPERAWRGAQREGLTAAQVIDLLDRHGLIAAARLEVPEGG